MEVLWHFRAVALGGLENGQCRGGVGWAPAASVSVDVSRALILFCVSAVPRLLPVPSLLHLTLHSTQSLTVSLTRRHLTRAVTYEIIQTIKCFGIFFHQFIQKAIMMATWLQVDP